MTEDEQLTTAIQKSLNSTENIDSQKASSMELDHESPDATIFDTIHFIQRPETSADDPSVTKIRFRLADGSRKVRRFNKTDPVRYLFEYIKSEYIPDQTFELVFNRQQLIDKIDQTIAEAGLENVLINVSV